MCKTLQRILIKDSQYTRVAVYTSYMYLVLNHIPFLTDMLLIQCVCSTLLWHLRVFENIWVNKNKFADNHTHTFFLFIGYKVYDVGIRSTKKKEECLKSLFYSRLFFSSPQPSKLSSFCLTILTTLKAKKENSYQQITGESFVKKDRAGNYLLDNSQFSLCRGALSVAIN